MTPGSVQVLSSFVANQSYILNDYVVPFLGLKESFQIKENIRKGTYDRVHEKLAEETRRRAVNELYGTEKITLKRLIVENEILHAPPSEANMFIDSIYNSSVARLNTRR